MMACFVPTTHVCKGIGRFAFASCQRVQTLTGRNTPQKNDAYSHNYKPDEGSPSSVFKNISLVTPKNLSKTFYNDFKLQFVEDDRNSRAGIELLRNIAANYDYWMIRANQANLLYYRLEMMLQRIAFLKSVGLDSKQKLRQIQKQPPLLLFTFTDCSYTGKLVYLRGLLHKEEEKFIHLFYPVSQNITGNKISIQEGVKAVEDKLKIKQPAVIRELLNMPCFFMDPSLLIDIEYMFIHKYSMPYYYSVDKHTAQVLPPISDLSELGLSPEKHFSNKASNSTIASLPTYTCDDILDYTYPSNNGRGTPECLTTFLLSAELQEEKDRTGGQPLRGIRGFNMPPRQY